MGDDVVFCRKCGQTKPRTAFYDQLHSALPRRPCKACILADKRARYATKDGDRVSHAQVLREKYNLTSAQYEQMLADQAGRCAICGQSETARGRGGAPRRLAVDHDHRSGVVRQLLCHRCNLVTWAVEENPALLDKVRAYLQTHLVARDATSNSGPTATPPPLSG
ncbi:MULTISPECIES: endonuclease domain-containing protein [unclassified Solwaraspora]|uniref:endonuclease domain-containing protein n=1 Tax=unclassified Solwaraspora TaxID=2627926 RepID=UPI00259B0F9A|nr:endonuclease domain-containing protein [Solwaraspora sp. WMMA2056]WJK38970.1 endonuclease domain-containing protein [Solwaraspora sp. WMMA2056]